MNSMTQEMAMAHVWMGKFLQQQLEHTVISRYAELKRTDELSTTQPVPNAMYVKELRESTELVKSDYENLFKVLQHDMPKALGFGDGAPDKQKMKMVGMDIIRCCHNMYSWELRNLQNLPKSDRLKQCRLTLKGFTQPTIDELNRFADFMATHFAVYPVQEPTYEMELIPGADMERLEELMDSFINTPEPDWKPEKKPNRLLKALGILYVMEIYRSND